MLDFVFAGVSVENDYANVLTLTLAAERPGVNAAPCPVWFDCTGVSGAAAAGPQAGSVYNPQYHDITYLWDFGDAANATPAVALNMPGYWKDMNTGYGKRVAHPFNDPGTYTVTCYAYEPATRRFGSETITVFVDDPDSVFAGNRTIIYNPNATADTSAHPGAQVFTTWGSVAAARTALGVFTPSRILIAPGVDFQFGETTANINAAGGPNLRIGALDPANANRPRFRPVGRHGGIQTTTQSQSLIRDTERLCREFVIYGIDFEGEWDSTSETGKVLFPFWFDKQNLDTATYSIHFSKCRFSGFDSLEGIRRFPDDRKAFMMYSECDVTNWLNYGILCGMSSLKQVQSAVIGSALHQDVDALSGGSKNGLYNNHGPLRDFGSEHLFVSVCDLFSRTGWSEGGDIILPDASRLGITADQAALRVNTTGLPDRASQVDRVAMEGGIWMREQDVTRIDRPGNHVLDRIAMITASSHNTKESVSIAYGGTTVRNFFGVIPNTRSPGNLDISDVFTLGTSTGSPDNAAAPVKLHNITVLDLRTEAGAAGKPVALIRPSPEGFAVVALENNLFHQPNRTGSTAVAGQTLDLAGILDGFTPRHKGFRPNFLAQSGTLGSAISGSGGTLTIPYSMITDQIYNRSERNIGTPTNQAYWQAIQNIDTGHFLQLGGKNGNYFFARDGDFTVTFGPSNVTITNTSGQNWETGRDWALRLDRKSLVAPFQPQMDSTLQDFGIFPSATDPNTATSADSGLSAYSDLKEVVRPATGRTRGAVQG